MDPNLRPGQNFYLIQLFFSEECDWCVSYCKYEIVSINDNAVDILVICPKYNSGQPTFTWPIECLKYCEFSLATAKEKALAKAKKMFSDIKNHIEGLE
jgi:hypothetical protein